MEHGGFLEQAVIYLAAAVLAVPIATRMKLGAVLGFLVAGIAIGPRGLGLIGNVETVLGFSEIGVVMLLFLVGLELEPKKLYAMRWKLVGAGTGQVLGTIAIATLIGLALGADWRLALVAAMGFAMSSTAIALKTLEDRKLLGTDGGKLSFAVLLFQDLAVIPLTLVLALVTPGERAQFDMMNAAAAVGVIVAVIAGGRLALRPLLRYIAATGLREIFIAFALLLVMGIALAMDAVGLSMALGSFLAGVLLAESEYRHELVLDIDPFKGLLLGLFFIAVGMSIDLSLFVRQPVIVLGLVAGVVALKIAVLYAIGVIGRVTRPDAALFAVALAQIGEFAFVIFATARTQEVLAPGVVDLLNAVVAGSMLLSPLVFLAYDTWIAPRLDEVAPREADAIEERNTVIVAGFGRFGQIVTRLLHGLGHGVTVVDHDPNQIEQTRVFGWKAYYGDAARLDLLESAGAARAKLLVVAVDDPRTARRIVDLARKHFPDLRLVVRARARTDAYAYTEIGVTHVRETFHSALEAGGCALRALGYGRHEAARLVRRFRRYDEMNVAEQAPHRKDVQRLIEASQQGREDLARLLGGETAENHGRKAWSRRAPGARSVV